MGAALFMPPAPLPLHEQGRLIMPAATFPTTTMFLLHFRFPISARGQSTPLISPGRSGLLPPLITPSVIAPTEKRRRAYIRRCIYRRLSSSAFKQFLVILLSISEYRHGLITGVLPLTAPIAAFSQASSGNAGAYRMSRRR